MEQSYERQLEIVGGCAVPVCGLGVIGLRNATAMNPEGGEKNIKKYTESIYCVQFMYSQNKKAIGFMAVLGRPDCILRMTKND